MGDDGLVGGDDGGEGDDEVGAFGEVTDADELDFIGDGDSSEDEGPSDAEGDGVGVAEGGVDFVSGVVFVEGFSGFGEVFGGDGEEAWFETGILHGFGVAAASLVSGEVLEDPVEGDVDDVFGAAGDEAFGGVFGGFGEVPCDGVSVGDLFEA